MLIPGRFYKRLIALAFAEMEKMGKALIIYFSQNKSTEKIAREIALGLKNKGCETVFMNILENSVADMSSYDIIGFGFPVYFFRAPATFIDFLKKMPRIDGKYFFVFKTFGSNPGDAANFVRKSLSKKGGEEVGYKSFMGQDHAYIYIKKNCLLCANHPSLKELESARAFGEELIKNIYEKGYEKPKNEKLKGFAYKFEYLVTSNFMVKKLYSHFYKVDKSLCDGCNKCVEICPSKNIILDENGYPVWGRNCIFCWHCELRCPQEAIKSPADWKIFEPFIKHSLKEAKNNPLIDVEEIKYEKGKIIRNRNHS